MFVTDNSTTGIKLTLLNMPVHPFVIIILIAVANNAQVSSEMESKGSNLNASTTLVYKNADGQVDVLNITIGRFVL